MTNKRKDFSQMAEKGGEMEIDYKWKRKVFASGVRLFGLTCKVAMSRNSSQSMSVWIIARAASNAKAVRSLELLTVLSSLCRKCTTCGSCVSWVQEGLFRSTYYLFSKIIEVQNEWVSVLVLITYFHNFFYIFIQWQNHEIDQAIELIVTHVKSFHVTTSTIRNH